MDLVFIDIGNCPDRSEVGDLEHVHAGFDERTFASAHLRDDAASRRIDIQQALGLAALLQALDGAVTHAEGNQP